MWIGRILLLGVGSSYICRWVLKPQRHRNYVAGWLKALRKTTGWLPRGRSKVRRFGIRMVSLHTQSKQPQIARFS